MLRLLYCLSVVSVLVSYFSLGENRVFAQDTAPDNVANEMEGAIEAYQTGNQGDVIRYFMQRGYEGNVAAQFNLGVINFQREEQSVGLREARFWFSEAAEEGDLVAQMNLGLLEIDIGVSQSDSALVESGTRWLRRAAESGYRPAQVNLGAMLSLGNIISPYKDEGIAWLQVASQAGDSRAIRILQVLSDPAAIESASSLMYPIEVQLRSTPLRGGSKVKTDAAPVYAEPSEDLAPIATMGVDALVEVLDRTGEWASVKIPAGLPVWISANSVEIEADLVRVDRLEVPLFATPDNAAAATGLGTATKGETLQLMEDRGEWLMVRSPERFAGWMRYIDIASKIDGFITEQTAESANETQSSEVSSEIALPDTSVMISDAEVFELPARNSKLIGVVAKDEEVKVIEQTGEYLFAEEIRVTGWVSERLLRISDNVNGSAPVAVVNTETARVRSRPSVDSEQIGRLRRNEKVILVDAREGWARVELGIGSGWVLSRLVSGSISEPADASSTEAESDSRTIPGETGEEGLLPKAVSSAKSEAGVSPGVEKQSLAENQQNEILQAAIAEEIGEEEQIAEEQPADPIVQEGGATFADSAQPGVVADSAGQTTVAEQIPAGKTLRTTRPGTILYLSNDPDSQPIGRLSSAIELQVDSDGPLLQLSSPASVYGWVFARLTRQNAGKAEIIANGVRIRLDPTTERDNIIGARNRGDILEVIGNQDDWLKVSLDPVTGWVFIADIEE